MDADIIVIGLGAMGSATLYQLAKRGVRATGIDRYRPPHDQGSSHGETRITRQAIGEGDRYVPLALRSHELWRELQHETGKRLLLECGFLAIDSSGGVSELHGKPGFLAATVAAAERFGIEHETLDPAEARRRFPQFELDDTDRVYHEPGGGLVFPEACIWAQLTRAEALGARIRCEEQVTGIEQDGAGFRVTTDHTRYSAARVVVTAGGWMPGLIGEPLAHLRLHRQVLHWFDAYDLSAFNSDRCPTFIWTHGPRVEDSFYGFPHVAGLTAGVKVATEQYSDRVDTPEMVEKAINVAETAAMHRDHVAGRLRGVSSKAVRGAVCFYTVAPFGDFLIEQHPNLAGMLLVSACSGHGFKHSAGLGDQLATMLQQKLDQC